MGGSAKSSLNRNKVAMGLRKVDQGDETYHAIERTKENQKRDEKDATSVIFISTK